MDNVIVLKSLQADEIELLKDASKTSQHLNDKAQEFREMLIERGCISSNDSYLEFKEKKELMEAIKICWHLGYDDEIKRNNLSGGKMSDFDFLQATPKKTLRELIVDDKEYEKLSKKRTLELQKITRNVDTFIRNMGWLEGQPKKKQVLMKTKEQQASKVDELLLKASGNDSITSGLTEPTTLGLGNTSPMVTEAEENLQSIDCDFGEEIKPPKNSNKKRIMMTADAQMEHLENMVTGDEGIAVFRDTEGAIQKRRLAPKAVTLMRKSKEPEIDFWSYDYWCDGEPMTVDEYIKWHEETGLEAEWMSGEAKDEEKDKE
jgi:hypothetical protein